MELKYAFTSPCRTQAFQGQSNSIELGNCWKLEAHGLSLVTRPRSPANSDAPLRMMQEWRWSRSSPAEGKLCRQATYGSKCQKHPASRSTSVVW
eukprot:765923-Hanusia_phi.AAC.5